MTTKPKLDIVRIVWDTRERAAKRPEWLIHRADVQLTRRKLDEGDYSLDGHTDALMIERKTLSDLCGSWTKDRERFEREWQRAAAKGYVEKHLLIEGRMVDVVNHNYRSNFTPAAFLASLYSWAAKYGYHITWLGETNAFLETQISVYWICRQFKRRAERGGG
jgi:ERCC4-type nuclease